MRLADHQEIAAEINRRRLLVYLGEQDCSSLVATGKTVQASTLTSEMTAFHNFRFSIDHDILHAASGGLGGSPSSPTSLRWLWPSSDADENKPLTRTAPPPSGEVNLFAKMNGGTNWTDALTGATWIKAVHTNELRWACETLSRGRWVMPIYFATGIISILPDYAWVGDTIANNGEDELRSIGTVLMVTADDPPRGLVNVTVRSTSKITLECDTDCTVLIGRLTSGPIDYSNDRPTWNHYAPAGNKSWTTPGGDYQVIGSLTMTAGVPNSLTGSTVASALQAMIDGGAEFNNIIVRRSDSGNESISVSGSLTVEFDLN